MRKPRDGCGDRVVPRAKTARLKPNGMANLQANLPVSQRPKTIHSGNLICFCRKFETTALINGRHRQSGVSDIAPMTRNHLLSASVLLMMSVFGSYSAQVQTEGWLRGPGSATGKESKIRADCIKAEDGSVTLRHQGGQPG